MEVWSVEENLCDAFAYLHITFIILSLSVCSSKYNFWQETGYLFRPPLKWYIHRVRPAATWKIPPKTDRPNLDPLYTLLLPRQSKWERALKLHAALNVNQSTVNLAREFAVPEEIKLFFYLIWDRMHLPLRRE